MASDCREPAASIAIWCSASTQPAARRVGCVGIVMQPSVAINDGKVRTEMFRVHELASELGISSRDLLRWLAEAGEFVKSASSVIQPAVERKARRAHAELSQQAPAKLQISVALLAKELHVKPNDVLEAAERIGLHRTRVAALLTPSQADGIRDEITGRQLAQVRSMLTPPARRPAAEVRADSARPGPAVGPPHACDCCGLRLPGHPVTHQPSRCEICSGHYAISGEDDQRVRMRLMDHERRLRTAYAVTWTREHEAEERMRSAFHSRDKWRGALVELMGEHEESAAGCRCGAKIYPCATWKFLERVNRGILRQVEEFLALKDDERDRRLYQRDHWDIA